MDSQVYELRDYVIVYSDGNIYQTSTTDPTAAIDRFERETTSVGVGRFTVYRNESVGLSFIGRYTFSTVRRTWTEVKA